MGGRDIAALQATWAARLRAPGSGLELEFRSGGRGKVLLLKADGGLLVRDYGGPEYHMGQCVTLRAETVRSWNALVDPSLHARCLESLVEAGFPAADGPLMLLPDELPSAIGVRAAGEPTVWMALPQALVSSHRSLGELARFFDRACYEVTSHPPTGQMPNPELHLWPEQPSS